jgi:type I restriction-modification system DNA methylase subunit
LRNHLLQNNESFSHSSNSITLQNLKSHLWNCAEILRGSAVDRTDWKTYILPLLFFKRICDVYDEEIAEAAELYGDVDPVEFPEIHRFIIPDGCHWRDIRETPANIGAALSRAMREIERANPETLYRVFGVADLLEAVLGTPDPERKAKEIEIKVSQRLRKRLHDPRFKPLGRSKSQA